MYFFTNASSKSGGYGTLHFKKWGYAYPSYPLKLRLCNAFSQCKHTFTEFFSCCCQIIIYVNAYLARGHFQARTMQIKHISFFAGWLAIAKIK